MLELIQIPVWSDNYAYLAVNGVRAFVVDSPDAQPILDVLAARPDLTLEAVVNTHHHPDHVGSNRALVKATGCDVVGPAHDRERIPGLTIPATVGTPIEVAGIAMDVLDVRAHTRGHIAYASREAFDQVTRHGHSADPRLVERLCGRRGLFVGDSLFLGGCGRLFEGTPADLEASMRTLAAMDPSSLVCCAHEYTGSNLRFATHVLPDDAAIAARLAELPEEMLAAGSSVPDRLDREFESNPFLMALDEQYATALRESMGLPNPATTTELLGALRAAKDRF